MKKEHILRVRVITHLRVGEQECGVEHGAGEERYPGFSGHRTGQQGLPGTRRADEEAPLGDLSPHRCVLVGVLKEVDVQLHPLCPPRLRPESKNRKI